MYAVARDVTERKRAEEEAAQRWFAERHSRDEASALASIAQVVAGDDLGRLLQLVAVTAQGLVDADLTYIADFATREILQVAAVVGERTDALRGFLLRPGSGAVGRAMQTGRPFQVLNYATADDIAHHPSLDQAIAAEGVVSILVVPIHRDERLVGVFWVASRTPRTFTDDEIALLERLANQAAIAIDKTRAWEREVAGRAERLAAQRAAARQELIQAYEAGRLEGIAIRAEAGACPICQAAASDVYLPQLLPPLPIVGCASPQGCRCQYSAPGFDPRRRPPPVPALNLDPNDIPRRLHTAARFGADRRGRCSAEELAEYLDAFPLLPIPTEVRLRPGEAPYLVRQVRRGWEQMAASAPAPRIPLTDPLRPWLRRFDRLPRIDRERIPFQDDSLLTLTNWRLVFSKGQDLDSVLLVDVQAIEYHEDALALRVGDRPRRLVLDVPNHLQVGFCIAQAVRDIHTARDSA